jgi:hypothetical protein
VAVPGPKPAVKSNAGNDEIANTGPSVSASEKRDRLSRLGEQKRRMAEMPKVTVRCPVDTRVQVNGLVLNIKGKTRVAVPEIFAEVLEQSGRI